MNEYIFYTTEGITLAPDEDIDVDNCQILGFVEAKDCAKAKKLLLENNPWIIEAVFSTSDIMVKQVLTNKQINKKVTIQR